MSGPDLVDELLALVERHHPKGAGEVLSALTGVLVTFARQHKVPLWQVTQAVEAAWHVGATPPARPS